MPPPNWSTALDFGVAVRNVRSEFVGDWHRDPWGWPELGYVLTKEPSLLHDRLNGAGANRAALIDVPKENWGSRPAVVLDILDRLAYQALIDRLSVDLIGDMTPSAFGWRLPAAAPKRGEYSHNNIQWDAYRNHLTTAATFFDVALKSDVVSFFASIPLDVVQEFIDDRTSSGAVTKRLFSLLDGFDKTPERSGLPQRSLASAVLANMVLEPVDDVLQHHALDMPKLFRIGAKAPRPPARSFARWMDDTWLFGHDAAKARAAQRELQDVARSIGLNINLAKTDVLEGAEVAEDVLEVEHSAVDDGLDNHNDQKPLEELVDRLLDDPENASRTSLKFVSNRMRDHAVYYRVEEFVALAGRMPHAADALAPLFRKVFTTGSLQEWFMSYARGEWAVFEWSLAQYARMFPSGKAPQKSTRAFYAELVDDPTTSLPLLAVAAQRLADWDATEARAVIRGVIAKTSHPQPRRVLSLAALRAGESRGTIKKWLSQEGENEVTLRMLDHMSFTSPKVVADFAA